MDIPRMENPQIPTKSWAKAVRAIAKFTFGFLSETDRPNQAPKFHSFRSDRVGSATEPCSLVAGFPQTEEDECAGASIGSRGPAGVRIGDSDPEGDSTT